jgi:hypothetical protein
MSARASLLAYACGVPMRVPVHVRRLCLYRCNVRASHTWRLCVHVSSVRPCTCAPSVRARVVCASFVHVNPYAHGIPMRIPVHGTSVRLCMWRPYARPCRI